MIIHTHRLIRTLCVDVLASQVAMASRQEPYTALITSLEQARAGGAEVRRAVVVVVGRRHPQCTQLHARLSAKAAVEC